MKNKKLQSGFGIIEVLISAIIIVMIVGASIALIRSMIKRNVASSERVQAYNLAREGLEIARAARDTAWIDGVVNAWCAYLSGCSFSELDNSSNSILVKDTSDRYQIDEGKTEEIINIDNVNFTRRYDIKPLDIAIGNSEEAATTINEAKIVTVIISWQGSYGDNTIQASTLLTDWKPQ